MIIPELIVGLGNPEAKYDQTRHNIGFEVVDALAAAWGLPWQNNKRFSGLFTEGKARNGHKIRLLKPLTYMNRSGEAVRAVCDWYKLPSPSLLVIYDDLDLPPGRLRMRLSGSAGGHNGMKSIISHLGKEDFPRLRLGIGKPTVEQDTVGHVLGKFTPDEKKIIKEVIKITITAVESSFQDGLEKVMSIYNSKSII